MNEILRDLEGPGRLRAIEVAASSPDIKTLTETCDPAALSAAAQFWRLASAGDEGLDQTNPDPALSRQRRGALLHQVSCTPTDGVAWAELASAMLDVGADRESVARALRLSKSYAPFEELAVVSRLRSLISIKDSPDAGLDDVYTSDMRTVIVYIDPRVAAEFQTEIERSIREMSDDGSLDVTSERIELLRVAFDRHRQDLSN